jgi:signal transduction histidine kinase
MTDSVSFQTRARTIDHLGREQIADVPTAVSELWKNAYDAYARSVSLHIYGSGQPVAAIFDDGTGMTRDQFVNRWLVVGTESKVGVEDLPADQRQGLKPRPKQGQKGIGRLSVAALGSTILVVSKRADSPFVACLIDWRLFENPFLYLHDIRLPVIEFQSREELAGRLPDLRNGLLENFTGSASDQARADRLAAAWIAFDAVEASQAADISTSAAIRRSSEAKIPNESYLADWPVWSGRHESGTALVMSELNSALLAWTLVGEASDREEADSIRDSLVRTLTGFSDPYADGSDNAMDYGVVNHTRQGDVTVVSREDGYGPDFLRSLDHCFEGEVDERGIFRGRVRAFGQDLGEVELIPAQAPPTAPRDRVGRFSIAIGAFEPIARSSILDPDVHRQVAERAQTHSGLAIYRDGLRVMPYGRPENDFFKIEERRQQHAGREFWASRRLFGRIAISRNENPNLRDKAGREGLIDNSASRTMQILIKDLLKTTARRYYGGDSTYRSELLPGVEAENDAAAAKSKVARTRQLGAFRKLVREQATLLEQAVEKVETLWADLEAAAKSQDADAVWQLAPRVDEAVTWRADLRLPPKPRNLGAFEDRYREYRDRYVSLAARVDDIRIQWTAQSEKLQARPAIDVARSQLGRDQKAVTDRLTRWRRSIGELLKDETARIDAQVDQDLKEFYKIVSPLLEEVETGRMGLRAALDEMDEVRDRLTRQFTEVYDPYLRALTQLSEGVDLEGAFAYAGAREATLERRLEQIQGLAQIGISVEILSHELNTLERRLTSGLSALAATMEETPALREAQRAGAELVERLRFLSQVQISGGDTRQRIAGQDIEAYLGTFFRNLLEERGIELEATSAFRKAAFQEFPSRIFPVFINLVNNSVYWLAGRPERRIILDAGDGVLRISDTGPGVDPDDQSNLFELFFTRRVRGRGVGLYLCRQTLAAGGHRIEYVAADPASKTKQGAKFLITLRNGFDG